jgi:parvulin-like peptidyl-prolyl isomerase
MKSLKENIKKNILKIDPNNLNVIKRGNLLKPFIKNLIINEISKNIFLEKDIVDEEIRKTFQNNSIKGEKDLKRIEQAEGLDESDLHYQIMLPLKLMKFAEDNLKNQLNKYFLKRKAFMDQYTFNIIRLKDEDLSYEVYFLLDAQEVEFSEIVKKYSYYNDLYPNGILGPKNLEGFHPLIKETLIKSKLGVLSQPFQVDEWWIILKLIDKIEVRLEGDIYKKMLLEIFDLFVNNLVKDVIKDFHKKPTIEFS